MTLYFEDNETTTIRDLIKKMRDTREPYKYGVDEVTLYLAKRDGEWLRRDAYDVDLLVRGEFPDSMKALLNENNKMDFGSLACDFDFRRMVGFPSNEIHRLYRQHRQEKEHFIERMRRAAIARAARRACTAECSGPGLLASRLLEHTFLLVRPGNCKLNALAKRSDKRATT
ncbi:hypothetical protein PI126_g1805 [Phytophthora idaei]|nr:hypothetical protein PI126_g1805 [Phytophthora idaei]